MRLDCKPCAIRAWRDDDAQPLARVANDPEVSRYMRDLFPHPYTAADARGWIALNRSGGSTHYAIETTSGELAGGIGYDAHEGERRRTATLGYWLGKEFWGRGIATAAVLALTERLLDSGSYERVEAYVYAPNAASARVLERCGYVREGTLRRAVVKHGTVLDVHLYARLRP